MKIVVTGAAGFIGSALALRLAARGDRVVGIDNLDPDCDVGLKRDRLARLGAVAGFSDVRADILDAGALEAVFARERPAAVVHLAGRPGVRDSLRDPRGCVDANVAGFVGVLEACRRHGVSHLVYASSGAVYGDGALPSATGQRADRPLSLYAAAKRANELMAHSYSHVHGLRATGLRLFTVYGPWDRSDMALPRFARRIVDGEPVELFNRGRHRRDYLYVDDAVEGLLRALDGPAAGGAQGEAPHRVYNLGSGRAVGLEHCVAVLERSLGRRAERMLLPLQPGDVGETLADVSGFVAAYGPLPETPLEDGVARFAAWYRWHRARR